MARAQAAGSRHQFLLENRSWRFKVGGADEPERAGETEVSKEMIYIRAEPNFDGDIVIAGAGPAGAAAAAYAARAGLKVLLLDWQKFPRDKICGDFVGPAALLELRQLGVTTLPEYRQTNLIRSAALFLDGKKLIEQPLPELDGLPDFGRVIPRKRLDAWIVQAARQAGAVVLEQHRATDFKVYQDRVELTAKTPEGTRTLRTRLLIGADGSESTIARLLRGHRPPSADRVIAVRAYFEGVSGEADRADLYFTGASFPGYYWLFPTGETSANVGLGMALETFPATRDHLRELLLRLVEQDAELSRRLQGAKMTAPVVGWPLTTYNPALPVSGDRVMLAGDAAGLINPLNGEGIQYALQSGRWAAETAVQGVRGGRLEATALEAYSVQVERAFRYDMALSAFVVQSIRNRNLNPLWLLALRFIAGRARHDAAYARVVGGILAGLVPASEALDWKIVAGTLEQAAVSTAWNTALGLFGGPRRWLHFGLDNAQTTVEMLGKTARHPVDFLKWGLDLAMRAAELGGQAARHTLAGGRGKIEIPIGAALKIPLDHVEHDVPDEPLMLVFRDQAVGHAEFSKRGAGQLASP